MITTAARLDRQAALIHPDLSNATIFVAGVGMLGSWTALALARCAHSVSVWDMDVVEDVNSGTQAYNESGIGKPKVEALADLARGLPLMPHIGPFPIEATRDDLIYDLNVPPPDGSKLIVVSGVDSFKARSSIAAWARFHKADLFIDTRAMGELAVVGFVPPHMMEQYLTHEIIDDKDAPEAPCGMTGTSYVGMHIASRVVSGLNAYLHGLPVPFMRVEVLNTGIELRRTPMDDETPTVPAPAVLTAPVATAIA